LHKRILLQIHALESYPA
jgi:hypothetical protein